MTITKTSNLSKLPQDCLGRIITYLEEKEKSNVTAAGRIFKEALQLFFFDKIIPADSETEVVPTALLIPAHRRLARAICPLELPPSAIEKLQSQHLLRTVTLGCRFFVALFSPDEQHVITPYDSDKILIYDTKTGILKQTLSIRKEEDPLPPRISALATTPDGKILISGANNGEIRIWNLETGECKHRLQTTLEPNKPIRMEPYRTPHKIKSITTTADGKRIILSIERDSPQTWDIETGERSIEATPTIKGYSNNETRVITPDRKNLIEKRGNPSEIVVLDIETGKTKQTLPQTAPELGSAATQMNITSDGKYVIVQEAHYNKNPRSDAGVSITIYDLENNTIKNILKNCDRIHFALAPNSKKIITAFDNKLKVYDIETAVYCQTIPVDLTSFREFDFIITPSERSLIINFKTREGGLFSRIYDIQSGVCQYILPDNNRGWSSDFNSYKVINSKEDTIVAIRSQGMEMDILKINPLWEDVVTASPQTIAPRVLLDIIQYLEVIAERRDRLIQNLVPSAIEYAIDRIGRLSPAVQRELPRYFSPTLGNKEETSSLRQNPTRSFLDRINKLPSEIKDPFLRALEKL